MLEIVTAYNRMPAGRLTAAEVCVPLQQIAVGDIGAIVTSDGMLVIKGGSTWVMADRWMIRVDADGDKITAITDARAPDGREWQYTPGALTPVTMLAPEILELLWVQLALLDPFPRSAYGGVPDRAVAARTTNRRNADVTPPRRATATLGHT